jgi:hypothetical protein
MQEKQAKSKTLRVRLTEYEENKLSRYAEKHSVSVSHVIREYIRRLPRQ